MANCETSESCRSISARGGLDVGPSRAQFDDSDTNIASVGGLVDDKNETPDWGFPVMQIKVKMIEPMPY